MIFRLSLALATAAAMLAGAATSSQASEDDPAGAVLPLGPVSLGTDVVASIDEQRGVFSLSVPLVSLPGTHGRGAVAAGVNYRHDRGAQVGDRFGLGAGMAWDGLPFVGVDDEVTVFLSDGSHHADVSSPTGLREYTAKDRVFRQETGSAPSRDGSSVISYSFVLVHEGGRTDYFTHEGDLVVSVDVFGVRSDYLWGGSHRLEAMIDGAGSRIDIAWSDEKIEIATPRRSDGLQATATIERSASHVASITNPLGERVSFDYDERSFLRQVHTASGALTEISYQRLADSSWAVDRVWMRDAQTGETFVNREWDSFGGEQLPSGFPRYANASALWASGDGEFRYRTQVSEGATRVISEFNSLGSLVSRQRVTASSAGDALTLEQRYTYPGTAEGRVPAPHALPAHYAKPVESRVVHRDGARTREVVATTEYDDHGRVTREIAADGQVTETQYDSQVPTGAVLSPGLVVTKTITGTDGTVSRTVNTLSADRRSVAATETFVGTGDAERSTSRTETDVDDNGVVTEERVVSTSDTVPGPSSVTTRFERVSTENTFSVTTRKAVGTTAEFSTIAVHDTVSGRVISEVDAPGRTATTRYDVAGRTLSHTDFSGRTTTTEHGPRVTRVTDPRGVTRSEYVNVAGNPIRVTDNIREGRPVPGIERTVETRRYENNLSRIVTTDSRGHETVTVTDIAKQQVETIDPNGLRTLSVYDNVDNTVTTGKIAGPGGLERSPLVRVKHKDDRDRVVTETQTRSDEMVVPDVTTRYDGLGRVSETIADDRRTTTRYNPDGTPRASTITPLNASTFAGEPVTAEREHAVSGIATTKTLSQKNGQTLEGVVRVIDAAGRVVHETDQRGNQTRYDYTLDGLVSHKIVTATGVTMRYEYDSQTRALTHMRTEAPGQPAVSTAYEYDAQTGEMTAVFDPAAHAETVIRYRYDINGNVTETLYPDGKSISHVYDEWGRRQSTTDAAGATTTYGYDAWGDLARVEQKDARGAVLAAVSYDHDMFHRVTKLWRANGVATSYTYTSAGQVATESTRGERGEIAGGRYEYDAHGNLRSRFDRRESEGPRRTDYRYNAYNQLVGSTVVAGEGEHDPRISSATYDVGITGDVLRETVTHYGERAENGEHGEYTVVRDFSYDAAGRLVGITAGGSTQSLIFDDAGNQLADGDGSRFEYNAANQLVSQIDRDGKVTRYNYWSDGQRQSHSVNEKNSTRFYWDASTLVNETSGSDEVTVSYLLGGERLARTVTTSSVGIDARYYIDDRHGSVVALVDAAGQVTSQYSYTDYGVPTSTPTVTDNGGEVSVQGGDLQWNPFQYSGEYTDPDGVQRLGARVYDPAIMRFRTADTADMHNLYSYANGNPIMLIDPTGQTPEDDDDDDDDDDDNDDNDDKLLSFLEWINFDSPLFKVLYLGISMGLTVWGFKAMELLTEESVKYPEYVKGFRYRMAGSVIGALSAALAAFETIDYAIGAATGRDRLLETAAAGGMVGISILVGLAGSVVSLWGKGIRKSAQKVMERDKKIGDAQRVHRETDNKWLQDYNRSLEKAMEKNGMKLPTPATKRPDVSALDRGAETRITQQKNAGLWASLTGKF